MSNKGGRLVASLRVGKKRGGLSEKLTIRAIFDDFASLPHKRNKWLSSPVFKCHGYEWSVRIYPRGCEESSEDYVFVSAYLHCESAYADKSIFCREETELALRLPNSGIVESGSHIFSPSKVGYGWPNFVRRKTVVSRGLLGNDGSLVVEADIQVPLKALRPWRPKNSLQDDMIRCLEEAKETGDVTFLLDDEEFSAHRHILRLRAPALYELTEGIEAHIPIPIDGVHPFDFNLLLRYVYANDIPEFEWMDESGVKDILVTADKFGCTSLKLLAESELVDWIADGTAADLILLADSKHCALLKEKGVEYFADNANDVMQSDGWSRIGESATLLKELVEASLRKKRPMEDANEQEYKRMRVCKLREELEKRDMDVDGSKELLVSRLEQKKRLDRSISIASTSSSSEDDDGDY